MIAMVDRINEKPKFKGKFKNKSFCKWLRFNRKKYVIEGNDDNDSDSDSDSDNSVVDKEYFKEQDNYQQINNDQKYVSVLLSDLKEIDQGITLSNKQFQKISDFAGKIKL